MLEDDDDDQQRCGGGPESRCMDAFSLVIIQRWPATVKSLQLVNTETCTTCRHAVAFLVNVADHTPEGLWRRNFEEACGGRGERGASPGGSSATETSRPRVPSMRVTAVRWACSKDIVLVGRSTTADTMTMEQQSNSSLLPDDLEQLTLCGRFNRPLDGVHLPPRLKRLELVGAFNRNVDAVEWPPTLEALWLGGDFCQDLNGVVWPPGLRRLVLGGTLARRLSERPRNGSTFPFTVERRDFRGGFNKPIHEVCLETPRDMFLAWMRGGLILSTWYFIFLCSPQAARAGGRDHS